MKMNERNEMMEVTSNEMISLKEIEYKISVHMNGAYRELLSVGRCLIEAKEAKLVPHGCWEEWVRKNTGFTERQAQRLMQAAKAVHDGSAMETLPISKIQVILTLPEPEREAVAEKAVKEDMSLRQLQDEVKRQKGEAYKQARIAEQAKADAVAAAEAYKQEIAEIIAKKDAEIEAAHKDASGKPDPEMVKEIERLKFELQDAEKYAEEQAEKRQQMQREMLNLQMANKHGTGEKAAGLTVNDLAAAVRTFIGSVGVLPHMGAAIANMDDGARDEIRMYLMMIQNWEDGVRKALDGFVEGWEA